MQYTDRLDDAEARFQDLTARMADPAVIGDPEQYRKTTKAQSELTELVTKYREWKKAEKELQDARAMLEESDLDLLVDATDISSLFTLGGLQEEAQQLLGVPVHVSTPENLSPKYRQCVIDEAEPLFRKKSERRNRTRGKF